MMHDGPFRAYIDPASRMFLKDLTDGYFPYEMKGRYPDGVPFSVVDSRSDDYASQRKRVMFAGQGNVLGSGTAALSGAPVAGSRAAAARASAKGGVGANVQRVVDAAGSGRTSSPVSVEAFLRRLPAM